MMNQNEEGGESLYPMYFGVSCAFIALKLLSKSEFDDDLWLEVRNKMLQGSAHLLGILAWKIQRRGKLEKEVELLKRMRREDAKANQKVVSIFASQEQGWLCEKRKLKLQNEALFKELQTQKAKKQDIENLIQSRDMQIHEAEEKRKEFEEKLRKAEAETVELREVASKESEKHTLEIWKHKTAVLELASNQRQLEAEMGRALRQIGIAKGELDSVLKRNEELDYMVQQLSKEVVKTRKDAEEKDKILSAMLRKSKVDRAEKEMLLQEVKVLKVERKKAKLEMENYRTLYELRRERNSSRSNLESPAYSRSEEGYMEKRRTRINSDSNRNNSRMLLLDYVEVEHREEWDSIVPEKTVSVVPNSSAPCPSKEMITTDVQQIEGWVRTETEKNTSKLEQRHQIEIDAFAEQLRRKDEKLETFRWQLLSMELESKQMQSRIDGLDKSLSKLRKENMNLEDLLSRRKAEQKTLDKANESLKDLTKDQKTIWSNVKIIRTKPRKDVQPKRSLLQMVGSKTEEQILLECSANKNLKPEAHEQDIQVEKEKQCVSSEEIKTVTDQEKSTWKMDLHSLGVSYNITRLKQQLLLLEKLVGMSRISTNNEFKENSHLRSRGFLTLTSLLNKQVSRYQSLQESIDDLCKRMHENDSVSCARGSTVPKRHIETKPLENFLQEILQLQRCMVATGQKLVDIQSRIASEFISKAEDGNGSTSFDMQRFGDSVRAIFKEIQKGIEIRIARLIGDIEEILACEGIIHS
ncbi:hypothetical protein ACHQM5_011199 [Ranunculus cassubicifolius]